MVGIFDSGLGGLSVWKELRKILPGEEYAYVADSKNCPYGEKTVSFIIERAEWITEFLLSKGSDIIVVACNTATAASIAHLREKYNVPFVGIEPAVKPAAVLSRTGVVGVLATANTLKAETYHRTLERFASNVRVISQVGEGLVELVERGELSGPQLESRLHLFIDPMISQGADTIVLGCTHFPFLKEAIHAIYGDRLILLDPAPAVAQQTARLLEFTNCTAVGHTTFYTNGEIFKFRKFVEMLQIDADFEFRNFP